MNAILSFIWLIASWISSLNRGASRSVQALAPVEEVPAARTGGVERDCGNPAQADFVFQRMAAPSQ